MKFKYTGIIASAIFALGFSSCLDLDTAPLDQKSDATMWQTTDDAMAGVSILYKILPDAMWLTPQDIYTDNAVYGIKWAAGNRAHGTWSVDDFDWADEYTYIRYANLVFANIDRVQDISESDRNNILGQAHFFRAYIYGELIKQFGDVPYIDKPLELSEQDDITREDWEVVYNKMIEDYDKAIQLLPATTSDGRVNKAVAYGFKARHALYFANPDCQHYIASGYQTAADCAKAIMDMGVYELYDGNYSGTAKDYTGKYAEMFWGLNMLNSKEALICQSSIASLNQGSYYIGFSAFPTIGWGGTNPTQGFVDCFE
ncbi:MAG: RagB/SusD family nutrient uptake outer membrane protein, partial [Muribaculaceae bacterium]|nr:RagB/SusD family nutrient uptake outer membrane protein [Muribaculaceae bacterium]